MAVLSLPSEGGREIRTATSPQQGFHRQMKFFRIGPKRWLTTSIPKELRIVEGLFRKSPGVRQRSSSTSILTAAVAATGASLIIGSRYYSSYLGRKPSLAKDSEIEVWANNEEKKRLPSVVDAALPACVTIHVASHDPEEVFSQQDSSSPVSSCPSSPYPPRKASMGRGSGFLVTEHGELLTNAHVIFPEGRKKNGDDNPDPLVVVTLHDGRFFPASILACDTSMDLALLRLQCGGMDSAASVTGKESSGHGSAVATSGVVRFPCLKLAPSLQIRSVEN